MLLFAAGAATEPSIAGKLTLRGSVVSSVVTSAKLLYKIVAANAGIATLVPMKFGLFTRAVNMVGVPTAIAAVATVAGATFADKAS